MVFPFMDHDLCGLLSNPEFKLTPSLAKLLFKQILEGMAYIHAVSDLRPLHTLWVKRFAERRSEQLPAPRHQNSQHLG